MSKAQIVNLRVTAEEKARWEARAAEASLKLAAWIRNVLNADALSRPVFGIANAPLPLVRAKASRSERSDEPEEEALPDKPPKQKRDKDGLLPICERCKRLGSIGVDRNYNCPTCGGRA